MPTIEPLPSNNVIDADAAIVRAESNLAANLRALTSTQPRLTQASVPPPNSLTWLFARDGSLTAMRPDDRWWAGCSIPRRAAEFMFRNMNIGGAVACFLSPCYAAQIRASLNKLQASQAIVAIVPEETTLAVLLRCDDFYDEIKGRRLWFVAGENWASHLIKLFEENPGLATATEFIRPIVTNSEPTDRLIAPAQTVFADVTSRRATMIQEILARTKRRSTAIRKICLVVRSRFRLWDDAGAILGEISLESLGLCASMIDLDRPDSASPLALAAAAASSDALLTADIVRSDAAGVTPLELPWITWITKPRIPSADTAGPRDRLILADPAWQAVAQEAGWDAARLSIARWPSLPIVPTNPQTPAQLSLIADTRLLEVPAQISEYSSQVLLWDFIRDELTQDPFALGDDIAKYLEARRSRFQISEAGFDPAIFAERLIVPAYQQGIAFLLIRERLPVRLFGKGWDAIDDFAAQFGGVVATRSHLTRIIHDSAALIHLWPWRNGHPIDGSGRPVLRARSKHQGAFVKEARMMVSHGQAAPSPLKQVLSSNLLSQVIASL